MGHEPRVDSPSYYKNCIMGLLAEAKENGIKVGIKTYGEDIDSLVQIDMMFVGSTTGEEQDVTVWRDPD
jgi:hypothetical protein